MLSTQTISQDWFSRIFIRGGILQTDSEAKARAIRLSNIIGITTVINAAVLGIMCFIIKDFYLVKACAITGIIFAFNYGLNLIGHPDFGRVLSLCSGNFIVFWFACYFRGESYLQLFFFTLGMAPFMYFSWEERSRYFLIILPIILLGIGEYYNYQFFSVESVHYNNMKPIQLFSIYAPFSQLIIGFFYFLKQSVKFENESKANLRQLEIEHHKQLQVQKMSSLGEMAGGIAHEINNPLAIILIRSQLLKNELKKLIPGETHTLAQVEMIESTVNRIAKIIRALLNFSRNASHDPLIKYPLSNIVNETLDLCSERFLQAQVKLKISLEEDLHILCRPTEISQVILNLLNNAYDAVKEKAEPQVELRARKLDDGKVEIIVEDNGEGISHQNADKIFQPFFTTKVIGKGTGLGLSVSSGLIADHNGRLSLIPNTGKTTFQILLPEAAS